MTATFVSFHVAADTEGLATARVGTFKRLLSCVRVTVYTEAARTAECLAARGADVSILTLRVGHAVDGVEVVVMLPRVAAG